MTVKMLMSVGDRVAGEEYDDLDQETADRFVILGYAEGDLSREYTDDERDALTAGKQEVSLGG